MKFMQIFSHKALKNVQNTNVKSVNNTTTTAPMTNK